MNSDLPSVQAKGARKRPARYPAESAGRSRHDRTVVRRAASTDVVPIRALRTGDSPRVGGTDMEHVRGLAEGDAVLPPILVHRTTMNVIDGIHRLHAAVLSGRDTIPVRYFDGTLDEAFVIAVKANAANGLPLTLHEREVAATRIIQSHPHWSDRAIASVAGLAPSTVGTIRQRSAAAVEADVRLGRDGRVRPVNSAEGRRRASEVMADRPDASLREVARAAGVSPAVARDVRIRLGRGDSPVPQGQRNRTSSNPAQDNVAKRNAGTRIPLQSNTDPAAMLQSLRKDPSLRYTEAGRALLRWLFACVTESRRWEELVTTVPDHCTYTVSDLARQCADSWLEFAGRLEQRARTPA